MAKGIHARSVAAECAAQAAGVSAALGHRPPAPGTLMAQTPGRPPKANPLKANPQKANPQKEGAA